MKNIIFLLFFVATSTGLAYKSKVAPLPPVDEVQSPISSVNEAIQKIYVSADFDVPLVAKGRLEANADLAGVLAQEMMALLVDTNVPNSQKSFHLIRYGLGDKRVTDALIDLRKAGIETLVITDLNPSHKGVFKGEEKFNSDFAQMQARSDKNPAVVAVNSLLAAGFELGKSLFSQPLYSEKMERVPIMHEKAALFRAGDKTLVLHGTDNLAPNPRYNRLYKIADPLFYDHYLTHIKNLSQTFAAGKEIDDTPIQSRRKIVYRDGSSQEMAFTDGKFNPNDRINADLQREFSEVVFSHFVNTHRDSLESLKQNLMAHPGSRVFGVWDDKFSSLHEWGLAIALEGFNVWSPFGKPTYGFSDRLTRQIESWVYQRPAIDPETGRVRVETSEDAAPTGRHVWHDKLTVIVRRGETTLYTGSLNLSNNFHNSEFQAKVVAPSQSWIAEGTVASVKGVVAKERMKWAVPMELATLRNAIGLVTGHTDLEIPLELIQKLYEAVLKRDYSGMGQQLRRVIQIKSNLNAALSPGEIEKRVNTFLRFLDWYVKIVPPSGHDSEVRIRRVASIAVLMGIENLPDFKRVQILKSVLWRPQITEAEQYQLVREGLPLLGYNVDPKYLEPMPVQPPEEKKPEQKGTPVQQAPPVGAQKPYVPRIVRVYDWDDTIVNMPTKIKIFEKGSNKEIALGTEEFAAEREKIGKPGTKFANFEMSYLQGRNSFEFFRTAGLAKDSLNFIRDDVKLGIETLPASEWQAPAFKQFVQDLNSPEQAQHTFVLTARDHAKEEMLEALAVIQKHLLEVEGIKIHLPPAENLIGVGSTASPSGAKAEFLINLAKRYQDMGAEAIQFFDDDKGNVEKANEVFASSRSVLNRIRTSVVYVMSNRKGRFNPLMLCRGLLQ